MDKVQKFGIISLIIFSVVISLAITLYSSCLLDQSCIDNNKVILTHFLHLSIVSAGFVGVLYAVIMLRGIEKTDSNISPELVDILLKEQEENNKKENNKLVIF